MSGLFKCVVFSCLLSVVLGLTNVRDDANWFKNGQRIKNRFVTGVVNGIVDFDCSDTSSGNNVEGECLSKVECTKSGGKVGGLCSLLGSCCVIEKSCSQSTSSKLSYFVPPQKFQTECALTVNVYSKDVCQIRLDFEKFDIAKPQRQEIKSRDKNEGYTSYQCIDDSFKVEETNKYLGFASLCGKNKGQHLYIPVPENQQKIVLRFNFRERSGSNAKLDQPDWRIKIRQLECQKSGYEHLLNAPTKLMALYNNLKNKKQPKSDWELIAPPNCLQYYPTETGIFESFNYDGGQGCYIGPVNYAICFRKTPDVCGARYTNDGKFRMNRNGNGGDNKCHPKESSGPKVSQDYIRIPGGKDSEKQYRDYYCDQDFNGLSVMAKSFEPLYVGVHTDAYTARSKETEDEEDISEIGFRIRYELRSGHCDILS